MKIGIPCHMLTVDGRSSECGVAAPTYGAHDGRSVDCLRCMKSKRYRVYMGIDKRERQTMTTKDKTAVKRQAAFREKQRKERDQVQVTVWVPRSRRADLIEYAQSLREESDKLPD